AFARVLVATELLAIDFYTRAIESKRFTGPRLAFLRRALFNEREHYGSVAQILAGAGQIPAGQDDIDFTYPRAAFATRVSAARVGASLETLAVGTYLGAVGAFQVPALKQAAARIAASEA